MKGEKKKKKDEMDQWINDREEKIEGRTVLMYGLEKWIMRGGEKKSRLD